MYRYRYKCFTKQSRKLHVTLEIQLYLIRINSSQIFIFCSNSVKAILFKCKIMLLTYVELSSINMCNFQFYGDIYAQDCLNFKLHKQDDAQWISDVLVKTSWCLNFKFPRNWERKWQSSKRLQWGWFFNCFQQNWKQLNHYQLKIIKNNLINLLFLAYNWKSDITIPKFCPFSLSAFLSIV